MASPTRLPVRRPRRSGPSTFAERGTWRATILHAGRYESAVAFTCAAALAACGLLALASAACGLLEDARDSSRFGVLAVAYLLVGGWGTYRCRIPERLRASTAFVGVLACWVTFLAASVAAYAWVGTFARLDDALFESVAGFTTTAATVVPDPEVLGRAVQTWRAGTQWLGGLTALLFVVAVLPSIGVGGLEVTVAGERYGGASLRSRRTTQQLGRLTGLYVGLTVIGAVLFLGSGLRPFDALTYAATTISTGGFGNHRGSFGHFDSAAAEWAGFGGMVLGGANMVLVFRVLRTGSIARVLRSFELRAYLTAIAAGGAVTALVTAPPEGLTHESVRQSLFHVAAAVSTTGHHVGDGWAAWPSGAQVLLLVVMGVGSMSGSAGGGFRQVRALALVGYLRRELTLQLQPRAVRVVRVGRRVVDDALLGRMVGYQVQYLLVAGIGCVALGALGADVLTATSAAISSLATVGPALGELAPADGGVLALPRPTRAVLLPLMLLGRLEIAPVLVGVAVTGGTLRRRLRRAQAWR